ncbi:hypothetical protein EW145_g1452 [Phellinidium pouzarii]|uniref:Uncharacterized protein n=1 Tax=Phellinidium pouzarii TaxID=167371 RepID=A0A4S4LEE2_9AGAM|nr:hypothetical protein EW145_g1452 [Phellinidium pouzarii]
MADLTILFPHSLLSASPASNISARYPHSANRFTYPNSVDVPASSRAPSPHGQQFNPSLLSPPQTSFHSAHRIRRARPTEEVCSPLAPEDDESLSDASEEDLDAAEFREASYTKSFRPFSYPSTPNLTEHISHPLFDLTRPPPPLFRPKTFWRNTRRSALTGPSYSPSSYLIRRSTFIAAGLTFDKPQADLSALGVELRVGTIVLVPSVALPL